MNVHSMKRFHSSVIGSSHLSQLKETGYCIVPRLAGPDDVSRLNRDLEERFERTPFCKGEFYGETTKRFGSLLKHSPVAQELVLQPAILDLVRAILQPHCDSILLNLTQAIEIHPGAPQQFPHRDQDMWGGPKGSQEYLVNVMWPLVPFTPKNGATVLWPGSQKQQDRLTLPAEDAIAAVMNPGSALLFLGSTLHAGGANRTRVPRRGIIVSYCLGWLRPFEAQMLIYPPNIARNFPPELSSLLGYAIHRPNLGNYEGQSPAVLLRDEPPAEFLPAVDALLPEHEAIIAQRRSEHARAAA